jgi:hypothetical protein
MIRYKTRNAVTRDHSFIYSIYENIFDIFTSGD